MKTLLIALTGLYASLTAVYPVKPLPTIQTTLSGQGWAYTVPFPVENPYDIEQLISCESQGVNISRPDSDGLISDGVLQFHRDKSDVLGSGTWSDMEKRFDYYGSPIIPADAIKMADLMISAGFLGRWTCAHITGLL